MKVKLSFQGQTSKYYRLAHGRRINNNTQTRGSTRMSMSERNDIDGRHEKANKLFN